MKKIIIGGLLLATTLLSSCSNEFLKTYPTDSVSKDAAFSSVTNAEMTLKGIHRRLYLYTSNGFYGEPTFNLYGDILGSTVVRPSRSNGWYYGLYNLTDMETNTADISYYPYRFRYIIIKNCNEILKFIDDVPTTTQSEIYQKANIKAQALAYRAYHYYQLGLYYADRWEPGKVNAQLAVPKKTVPEAEVLPRAPLHEIYQLVHDDADAAIALFKGDAGKFNRDSKVDLSINATYMIKARLYMIQGLWKEAEGMAKEVINSGKYRIMGNELYFNGFSNGVRENNPEWIWGSLILSINNETWGSLYAYISRDFPTPFTQGDPNVMEDRVYNAISDTDSRKKLYLSDDQETINKNGNGYYFNQGWSPSIGANARPYMSKKYGTATKGDDTSGDVVYMRLAEAYYIAAEAAYMNSDQTSAANYMKAAIEKYDPAWVAPSGEELLKAIKMYKFFDLWSEGRAWEDYKRRGDLVDRNNTNHDITHARIMKYQAGGENSLFFKMRIPKSALDSNTELVP